MRPRKRHHRAENSLQQVLVVPNSIDRCLLPRMPVNPKAGFSCTETVSKPLLFWAPELCLSEKQTPQVIVFIKSRQKEESV